MQQVRNGGYFTLAILMLGVLCLGSGCQTVKELAGIEDEISDAELLGIWYKRIWEPSFRKVSWDESKKKQRPVRLADGQPAARQAPRKIQENSPFRKIPAASPRKRNKIPALAWSAPRSGTRAVLLKPGEERKWPFVEVYLPRFAQWQWSLILEPDVQMNSMLTDESLYQYAAKTFVANIENIQGKIGIGLEW